MAVVLAIITLLLMVTVIILSIPFHYTVYGHIGDPFSGKFTVSWSGRAFLFSYSYTYGKRPIKERYIRWHTAKKSETLKTAPENSTGRTHTVSDNKAETVQIEVAVKETLERDYTQKNIESATVKERFPWRHFILTQDFITLFLVFFHKIISHSCIRKFTLTGTIGLSEPHETGMLAGWLYTFMAKYIRNLSFNYSNEEYNVHCTLSGRIIPLVLIYYTLSFILTQEVRTLYKEYIIFRRGQKNGQQLHQE